MFRPSLPDQHRGLYARLLFLMAGRVDGNGRFCASALFGQSGLVTTPTDRHLSIGGGQRTLLDVDVVQSYGNCPQDIRTRNVTVTREPQAPFDGARLPSRRRRWFT